MSERSTDLTKEKDSYVMQAKCTNCGWSGIQTFARGVPASNTLRECPGCGCSALNFMPSRRYK